MSFCCKLCVLLVLVLSSVLGFNPILQFSPPEKEYPSFIYPKVFNNTERDGFVPGIFPADFKFGLATASYQIEGAWNVDGKGMSIWDTWTQTPGHTHDNETGNNADKSYFKWDDDVRMLQTLGADFYRFSISWPRIIPKGLYEGESSLNQAGIDFYNSAIDKLIAAGVEPLVTLFHWDLPQTLQDMGGQTDPRFPVWFSGYARVCFQLFGDRVKHWLTFNEPQTVAGCYDDGSCAPGIYSPGVGSYQVVHQQLLAHQSAWHIYNKEFRQSQNGQVGITISTTWTQPVDDQPENIAAADRANEFDQGWLLSPLIGTGNYPEVMINVIANVSAQQGYEKSRLPVFTPEEQKLLLGAVDFFGLNYYGGQLGKHEPQIVKPNNSKWDDQSVQGIVPPDWPTCASPWLHIMPYGIRYMFRWVQERYGHLGTDWYLTENGFSAYPEKIPCSNPVDIDKVKYIAAHVNQIYRAVTEDGIRLKRYTLWSLIDNFEWDDAYSKKFGIYCVNFSDPDRFRFPRYSASVYHKIMKANGFPPELIEELLLNEVLHQPQ